MVIGRGGVLVMQCFVCDGRPHAEATARTVCRHGMQGRRAGRGVTILIMRFTDSTHDIVCRIVFVDSDLFYSLRARGVLDVVPADVGACGIVHRTR